LIGEDQSRGMNAAVHCWLERQPVGEHSGSPWDASGGWSLVGTPRKELHSLIVNGRPLSVEIIYHQGERLFSLGSNSAPLVHGGEKPVQASYFDDKSETHFVTAGGVHYAIHAEDLLARASEGEEGASIIRAPMPGRVIRIAVEEGQKVSTGTPLVVLEAMKMEHTLKAGLHGTVKRLPVSLGAQVKEGDALCVLEGASP
jgi:3-methylcrotonyl-CoA carboxylase alpha subunit